MSKLLQIAGLIPAEYRKEILDLQMIERAVAKDGDECMHYLNVIYKNYIDPEHDPTCNLCHARVLKNFRNLKQTLIELEKNNNLLQSA